jgi:hypothetical protein
MTMRVSSVVTYWTPTHGVTESQPGRINLFHAAAILLVYITQRITTPKFCIFENILPSSLYDTIVSGASVDPTSEVRSSVILVLLIVGNHKVRFCGILQWFKVHTIFRPNPSMCPRVES